MKKIAFIGRHEPTAEQIEAARKMGAVLVPFGDIDGNSGKQVADLQKAAIAEGVVGFATAHVGCALRLCAGCGHPGIEIWVTVNAQRPKLGGGFTFEFERFDRFTTSKGEGVWPLV